MDSRCTPQRHVIIAVPAVPDWAATLRMIASRAAACADLTVDEIADVVLAVDETFCVALRGSSGPDLRTVDVTVGFGPGFVHCHMRVRPSTTSPTPGSVAQAPAAPEAADEEAGLVGRPTAVLPYLVRELTIEQAPTPAVTWRYTTSATPGAPHCAGLTLPAGQPSADPAPDARLAGRGTD